MLLAMEAANSRKWTPEYDERLAELERKASHQEAARGTPGERALAAAMLAMTHGVRCQRRSVSPQSAEHRSVDEFTAVIAESESALELLRQLADGGQSAIESVTAIVQAHTAMLLVDLSRLDGQRRSALLARARAHFEELPAEMLEGMPLIGDMSALQQLMEGRIQPTATPLSRSSRLTRMCGTRAGPI